jgi:hypothetical protein
MDEPIVRAAVHTYVETNIPADSSVLPRVLQGTQSRGRRSGWKHRRLSLGVAGAGVASLVLAGGVFAAQHSNFPIHLSLLPAPAQPTNVPNKIPAGGPPPFLGNRPGASKPGVAPQVPTTVSAAQSAFGHPIVRANTSSGAQLQTVYFRAIEPVPAGAKPGSTPQPAQVTLMYAYGGTTAEFDEEYTDSSGPLEIGAINGRSGPTLKGPVRGPITPAIETVAGSQYLVGYSGTRMAEVMWKTSSGVVVALWFGQPINRSSALALVSQQQ